MCVCLYAQHVSKLFWNFLHTLCGPSASSPLTAQWSWLPDSRGGSRHLCVLKAALWGASPARAPCLEAGSSSGGPEATLQGLPGCPRSLLLAHEVGGPPVSHSLQRFQVRTRGIRQITPKGKLQRERRNLNPPHDLGLEKGKKKKDLIQTSMSAETPFLLSPQLRH